uniref:Uncharacterized protein n=1 Tax=Amphilophus citrinellus TaxID=61819 RepID=A0A3Q0QX15_AMPCI
RSGEETVGKQYLMGKRDSPEHRNNTGPGGNEDDHREKHLLIWCVSERITLKKPAGAILRIGGLEDTVYKDYPTDVKGWGKFYLPKTVTMHVVGVVEGISCPCDQLVLMTCEDKQVYVYDEEELHLVASSMEQLREEGMTYPAFKTYYNGEAFKDMTQEDWKKVWEGPVGRRLDEEHKKLVATRKPRLLDYLKQNQMLKSS